MGRALSKKTELFQGGDIWSISSTSSCGAAVF